MKKAVIGIAAVAVAAVVLSAGRNDEALMSWDFPLQDGDAPSGRQFHFSDGSVHCGGGYVYAIQSRKFSNSNDLEFWCRNGDMDLDFRPLPKAIAGVMQTSLTNIEGRLYDFQSESVFDFEQGIWIPHSAATPAPWVLQPTLEGQYAFSLEQPDCPGMSVYLNGDYRGTVAVDMFSAVAAWGRTMYVNTGDATLASPIPQDTSSACEYLEAEVFDEDDKYAYGIFKGQNGGLVIGGSQGGYFKPNEACVPPLEIFQNGSTDEISENYNATSCSPGEVKEYYSYAPRGDEVLIGNFPLGTLLALKDGELTKTSFGEPQSGDWQDPRGTYYRESQAVVNTFGGTFIGMYPWGEVIAVDHHTEETHIYRLFSHPQRDDSPTPYFWPAHNRALNDPAVAFDSSKELVYSLTRNGQSLREEGREPTLWGQRIPSIVVLSGRLCASTGNLDGQNYKQETHKDLTMEQATEYGRVHCALLPGHIMAPMPKGQTARFIVTDRHLEIVVDGVSLAKAEHGLSQDSVEIIAAAAE